MCVKLLLYAAISLLTVLNIGRFAELVMNRERKKGIVLPAVYVALSVIYKFVHLHTVLPVLDLVLLAVCYIWLFICVKKAADTRTFQAVYMVLLYLSIDSLIQSLFKYLLSLTSVEYNGSIIPIMLALVSGVLIFLFISGVGRKKSSVWQLDIIPRYIYILILLAIFFGGGLIEIQLSLTNIQLQGTLSRSFTVITIVLLVFIMISLIFNCISKAYLENVSSMLENQVKAQVEYYKKTDKLNTELRNFRHDYKNHLLCVQGLLDGGEYDEAKDYVSSITHRQNTVGKEFFSGNSIVNAILADKSEAAESVGAQILFKGIVYEEISAADICTIFANALDNAVEACAKLPDGVPKIISVKCSYVKHIQFICITNPTAENVKIVNNAVETSKNDKNLHGIGLYNIRSTVRKYNGEFNISCKDGQFVMEIGFNTNLRSTY